MHKQHRARRRATSKTLTFSLLIGLVLVALLAAAGSALALAEQPAPGDGVGRALAEFGAGVTPAEAQAVAASCQATLVREVPRWGTHDGTTLYAVTSDGLTSQQLTTALREQFAVTRAAPDGLVTGDEIPNDTDRQKQWGLNRIWAFSAWDVTHGDPNVVVAVLDGGATTSHPDLADNVWTNAAEAGGTTGVDDDLNGYIDDVYGIDALNHDVVPNPETEHGIHVAGIVSAVPDNNLGVAGVGWNTKVMILKCLGGADNVGTNAAALECVNYVLDQKINHGVNVAVINTSWGGDTYPYNQFLRDALDSAQQAGIVWVASAGNDESDLDAHPRYPASYDSPDLITVGATILYDIAEYPVDDLGRATDDLALWSNYGKTTVDLGAPGRDIYSLHDGAGYGWLSGTSQAAPFVSGAAALCAAKYPAETALERVDRVLTGVDHIGGLEGLVASAGRLNVFKALNLTADAMKPSTRIGGVDAAWHTGNVTVTLTGDDGTGIGIDYSEYKLDGGSWTKGTGFTVSTDGSHVLQYRSVDKAGRTGDTQSATGKVDRTAPISTLAGVAAAWSHTKVEPTLSADDATSGVAQVSYRINGGAWLPAPVPAITSEGVTTIEYKATDVAGNEEAVRSATVRIDTKAPATKGLTSTAKRRTKAKLRYVVNDEMPGSGMATVSRILIKNRKGKTLRTYLPKVSVPVNSTRNYAWKCNLAKGKYTFVVFADDLAGNAALRQVGRLTVR